ncbi:hydroxyacid dehydrogenase [Coraliomargarita parva]|uniref:hydroxyacid dehydrogenase n=1 Tax=Coraliomargarita parva TaxID=3014050 RepID=UPI0022B346E3|nr:hydroxyacid dehydrogenase [Coraliomargarita parva]
MSHKPKSIFILNDATFGQIYSETSLQRIHELTDVIHGQLNRDTWEASKAVLAEVEYIFSGWGMPNMDADFLEACPKLKHVFYGAGSVRAFYTEAARARGIGLCSAWRANAIPVAEFAHATILLALKKFWRINRMISEKRQWERTLAVPGAYDSTVGLVSLGAIGRMVAERLGTHHLKIVAYDPFANPAQAEALGVKLVSLEELFATSDVISLHTPNLPETRGLVSRALLESMKEGATLINTARGAVIDEPAMVDVLRARPDLDALLDVTVNEPVPEDDPLWDLPNVVITPHIAGSLDNECQRMGQYMVEECERLLQGAPLQHEVTEAIFKTMA